MGFIKEFQEFAVKGNVMDMAVGVIIGGAFGKIVASLVNDIIMPPLGLITGNGFTEPQALFLSQQQQLSLMLAVTSLLLKLQKLLLTMVTSSRILLILSSLRLLSSYSSRV